MALVEMKEVLNMASAVTDTGAGLNLLKRNCPPQNWTRHAVTMEATRLKYVAITEPDVIELIRLGLQLEQRIAKTSFSKATTLTINTIIGTSYISEITEKISFKISTLKPTASSPVAIEESICNAVCLVDNVKSKRGHPEDVFNG